MQIVQDDELRNLLMDPKLQQILQECNDPRKFQAHMRDPVTGTFTLSSQCCVVLLQCLTQSCYCIVWCLTAYKIKKLYDAGLVGTAK